MKRKDNYEEELASLIPEAPIQTASEYAEEIVPSETAEQSNSAKTYLGQSLTHKIGGDRTDVEGQKKLVGEKRLTKIGENLRKSVEVRDGWMEVDRRLLQERDIFYPEDWRFYIKPAEVQAIRNWSTIDDENPNSIDDVFNEILKNCLSIRTSMGTLPWNNINSWDRFFFILLVREYTFMNGEKKVEFEEECPECEAPVIFKLESLALTYDLPDPEVMKYYDRENRCWYIDPSEFDVDEDPITLYLPTLDKDAKIKNYAIERVRDKKKLDEVFIKFAQWLTPKITKDENGAKRQIRELELQYKNWNSEMFAFMDSVIRNIIVMPSQFLKATCPKCGEEITTRIRFQDGVKSLFDIQNRFKKFGKK